MSEKARAVRLSGKLICASQHDVEIVKQYLPEHVRLTKAEPGCLSFDVLQTSDPLVWQVKECFTDQQAFDEHQLRTRSSDWWQATSKIKREYDIVS